MKRNNFEKVKVYRPRGDSIRLAKWGVRFLLTFWLVLLITIFLPSPAQAQPIIFPSPLPGAQVGVLYSATLGAIGGTPPYHSWTVVGGILPPGLALAPATGVISGTPTTAGTYSFFVTVRDSTSPPPGLLSLQQGFFITVAASPITFIYPYLPEAMEGRSYRAGIMVSGGNSPYTYSLVGGRLPSGLNLDSVNGTIFGTPTKGTAGSWTIIIGVTDSSTPPLSALRFYSLVVKKGFFESTITIASSLSAGETNLYLDGRQVTRLRGGQIFHQSFPIGTKLTITVDPLVSHPTRPDIRFKPDLAKIIIDELFPDATFNYYLEYYLEVKTDPSQIAPLIGSGWYKEGSLLKSTAQPQIEKEASTQYRFSHWLMPTGEKLKDESLSWVVSGPGKVVANYNLYYQLTVISPHGKVKGSGWYQAGTPAEWSTSPEVPMSGILGFFKGKLKPETAAGTLIMDAPKTVTLNWKPDYFWPVIFFILLFLAFGLAAFFIYRRFYLAPRLAVAPSALVPSPAGKTREELVEQFRQLLQKYEEEVRQQPSEQFGQFLQKYEEEVRRTAEALLLEDKLIPEARRLAPLACGYSSKNLLRTVVSNWRKKEEKVIPPSDQEAAEKGLTIFTVWARDIYNEWEIFTCSLFRGHSGNHRGATSKAYTLQNTVTEERTYSLKQKITPPKPHFTDQLPVVEVTPNQVIAVDQTITPST